MADGTVFDSVFKTMVHKAPRLVIPLINEVFGRSYPTDAELIQFSNEHEGPRGANIDDSVFRLGSKIYHVECQSTPDTNMVVRMIEYDFSIALEETLANGTPYRMEFPSSCVLFLRHTSTTPDVLRMEVALPDGRSFEYQTKVVKVQLVSSDDIFGKRLLILLPYYLMRYERELARIATSQELSDKLVAECNELQLRLAELTLDTGDGLMFEEMTELIIRVSDHVLAAYESLQKKVRAAMGGEVLELLNDRAKRMEREAHEKGLAEGRAEGREEGRAEGRIEGHEQAVDELSRKLSALGVDQETIEKAVADMRASQEAATE